MQDGSDLQSQFSGRRLRQENCFEFEATLGYTARHCLKNAKAEQIKLIRKQNKKGGRWALMTPHLWSVRSNSRHFRNVLDGFISVNCLQQRAIRHFPHFEPRNKRVLGSAPETKQEPFLGCVV